MSNQVFEVDIMSACEKIGDEITFTCPHCGNKAAIIDRFKALKTTEDHCIIGYECK